MLVDIWPDVHFNLQYVSGGLKSSAAQRVRQEELASLVAWTANHTHWSENKQPVKPYRVSIEL